MTAVPNFLRLCIATSQKILAERRDDLVRFVAAEMDAYKYAVDHRDAAVKLSREMTHAKPGRQARRIHRRPDARPINRSIRRWRFPTDRIEWMQDLFIKAGVIKKAVPMAKIVDTSVRDDAAKLAGK